MTFIKLELLQDTRKDKKCCTYLSLCYRVYCSDTSFPERLKRPLCESVWRSQFKHDSLLNRFGHSVIALRLHDGNYPRLPFIFTLRYSAYFAYWSSTLSIFRKSWCDWRVTKFTCISVNETKRNDTIIQVFNKCWPSYTYSAYFELFGCLHVNSSHQSKK